MGRGLFVFAWFRQSKAFSWVDAFNLTPLFIEFVWKNCRKNGSC